VRKSKKYAQKLMTIGRQAKQGASMGFADEIQDLAGAGLAKAIIEGMRLSGRDVGEARFIDILKENRDRSRAELAQDWENSPYTSAASNIAGFLPFALGQAGTRSIISAVKAPAAATGAANAISKFNTGLQGWASTGGRLARAGKGAAIGAGYGAISGAGAAGDTIKDRLSGSAIGSAIGAVTGGAGGAASRAAPTRQNVAPKVAGKVAENKAEQEFLRQLLLRPDLTDMQKRALQMQALSKKTGIELTLPEMLAQTDVDPLLAQQAVLAKSPETAGAAQSLLQRRMGDPIAGQTGQLVSALQRTAGDLAPGSYDDLAQQLMQRGKAAAGDITKKLQAQAGPLYSEAQNALVNPDVFKDPVVKQAVETVFSNPAYMREIAPDTQPNSIKVLDLAYKAIRDTAEKSSRAGDRNAARLYGDAAEQLVAKMDEAAPVYKQARSIYSSQQDVLGNRELMGELANIDQLEPEKVVRQLYSGTPGTAQRTAQALGPQGSNAAAAAKIQDIVGGLKSGSLPPRLDADTISMLRAYAGPKADSISELLQVVDKARAGERFLRGSQTQTNQAIQGGMDNAAGAAIDAVTGNKIGLMRRGVDFAREAIGGNSREQYNMDLLKLFTQPRGIEALNEAVILQQKALAAPNFMAASIPATSALSNISTQRYMQPNVSSAAMYSTIPAATQSAVNSQLPAGFVVDNKKNALPNGFIIDGGK
jgi:hypothetical protein